MKTVRGFWPFCPYADRVNVEAVIAWCRNHTYE